MIILTSNGLSSPVLIDIVKQDVQEKNYKKAYIIVTADHEYKQHNWHVERLRNELKSCNLTVELFDFDQDKPAVLNDADVIEINGGNPFYLLDRLKKNDMMQYFYDFAAQGKLLIGMSAGSFVLQKNIELVSIYSKDMNFLSVSDLTGMNLVSFEILPHYSRFINRFEQFEEKCKAYEAENNVSVIRLNDGEAVVAYESGYDIIRNEE